MKRERRGQWALSRRSSLNLPPRDITTTAADTTLNKCPSEQTFCRPAPLSVDEGVMADLLASLWLEWDTS